MPQPSHTRESQSSSINLLRFLALLALAAQLCRRADGSETLSTVVSIVPQLLLLIAWTHFRCQWFTKIAERPTDSVLTIAVGILSIALALQSANWRAASIVTTSFVSGSLIVDELTNIYRRLDDHINQPPQIARTLRGPWLVLLIATTVLLSIPIAAQPGVPDYLHNFWNHVLNNAFAAAGACSLAGAYIYDPGEDYSLFGQAVLFVATQLSALGFVAIGLAIAQPLLQSPLKLSRVLKTFVTLELIGGVGLAVVCHGGDGHTVARRLWWGVFHSGSALSGSGMSLRSDGLSTYLSNQLLFAVITTLAIIGSLGIPVLLDVIRGASSAGDDATIKRQPWRRFAQWEATTALILLVVCAGFLFLFETPYFLPSQWTPEKPFDPGSARLSPYSEKGGGSRWARSVFVSATLGSSAMQSIPVERGSLSWPSVGLLLGIMIIGGSAAGAAGGIRMSAVSLFCLCVSTNRFSDLDSRWPQVRALMLRRIMIMVALWLAFCVAAVAALMLTGQGTAYERIFDGLAAANGVGLSTGLSLHLTPLSRLVMIAIMIAGRWLPTMFWLSLANDVRLATTPQLARPAVLR